MASATTKVNLKDPAVQAKVKQAGIRWRLKDYESGLELTEDQMAKAGLTAAEVKASAKASASAETTGDAGAPQPPRGALRGTPSAAKKE